MKLPQTLRIDDLEHKKIFYTIDSIVKVVYKASKDKQNDDLFIEENIAEDLLRIIHHYFIKNENILVELTQKVISKPSQNQYINNSQKIFELLIYTTGTLKNISGSERVRTRLTELNGLDVYIALAEKLSTKFNLKEKEVA